MRATVGVCACTPLRKIMHAYRHVSLNPTATQADACMQVWVQVKGLQGSPELLPQRPVSRVNTLRRSNSSSKLLSPRSHSKLARVLHRSQHSTPAAVQRQGPYGPADSEEIQETMQAAPSESYAGAAEDDSPR